jgi:hypothetical protein
MMAPGKRRSFWDKRHSTLSLNASVIRYSPPKSQVWGHQVGRLPATAVVEKCLSFLESHCAVIDSQSGELMIGWSEGPGAGLVEEVIVEVDRTLGQPTTVNDMPSAQGTRFRQRRWPFPAERLPVVATWFDRLSDVLKTQGVVAHSSTNWIFAWRGEPEPLSPTESAGGMLGIHLGRRNKITTLFSFRNLQQYASIKAALTKMHLVELQDKHLRPKVAARPAKA